MTGTVNRKVDPSPTRLSTPTAPPWASMIPPHDSQAEPDASTRAALGLPVALENPLEIFRRDAVAGVRYRQLDEVARWVGEHANPPAVPRELDGIP